MSPIGSAAILWAAAARRGLNPVLMLLRARGTPAGSAGALNLQVYECERCDWERRLNIWQRNGRSADTNKSRAGSTSSTPSPSVSPTASGSIRKDSFHEIHWATRAFGSRCRREGRGGGGRGAQPLGCRQSPRIYDRTAHGSSVSFPGGPAAAEADRHRPSEIRKHKSLTSLSLFAQSHRNRLSPETRKAVKIRHLLRRHVEEGDQ